MNTALERFRALYPFELDTFQVEAAVAVAAGDGVLVAAPTGAGKTVVGECAVHLALEQGRKCFYTTPIKALSNQKYTDFVDRYGPGSVGLLTGDNSINSDAPVVVMTTEVLRNMLYTGSGAIRELGFVVMDEVHYLADRFRGAVWEEVIIHLPESVQLVSLSATVSNAEEFAAWLTTVRGSTHVIVEEARPVPLWQHVMIGPRLYDLFATVDDVLTVSPDLLRVERDERRRRGDSHRRRRDGQYPRRAGGAYTPRRAEVVAQLDAAGLLPAITFVFSRAGCDAAVEQCIRSGVHLLAAEERAAVAAVVRARCAHIPAHDRFVLGYSAFADGLGRGLAAHHAGMLPVFKEIVEELFTAGLVRAVFATETLALGINMPARTVVLERLTKWNGETHADLTAGEYTQLTGRAGRRGIDVEGHAVVLWQPDLDVTAVGGLASTRTYPLVSSFRPSYNMAVNLLRQYDRARARELLGQSFAQFQADRAVVSLTRRVQRNEEALVGYRESMQCRRGDINEYVLLRRTLSKREKELARERGAGQRAAAVQALEALRPGDVVDLAAGRRGSVAVVVGTDPSSGRGGPRPTVVTADRQLRRIGLDDLHGSVVLLGFVRLPRGFDPRSPKDRRDLVSTMRNKGFADSRRDPRPFGGPQHPKALETRATKVGDGADVDGEVGRLRRALRAHPCHGCADREDHVRWAERYAALADDTARLARRADRRTNSVAHAFDRTCDVLVELGYLRAAADGAIDVTDSGRRLGRLYTELDLLAAECLRAGVWDGLDPAELAACVSALVFESRRPEDATPPPLPPGAVSGALAETAQIWARLEEIEARHHVRSPREPDVGFAAAAHAWAGGAGLEVVLADDDLTPGDFVRWTRQLVDVLGQIADAAAEAGVRASAGAAIEALRRGVVAYSSVG